MNKIIFFCKKACVLLLFFLSIVSIKAQEISKLETIHKIGLDCFLNVHINYNEDMVVTDRIFSLYVQNSEYEYIEDYFQLVYGSAQDAYDLLSRVDKFVQTTKEDGLRLEYDDYVFRRVNFKILKGVYVNITGQSKTYFFKEKDAKKILKSLLKYCNKNQIELRVQ